MEKSNKKGNQYVTNAQYNESLEKIAKLIESETGDKKPLILSEAPKQGAQLITTTAKTVRKRTKTKG